MADKKIAASLVNVIKFDIDRASMQRAIKAIKDVKKAMSDVTAPFNAAKRYTNELKRQTAELQKQKALINSTRSTPPPPLPPRGPRGTRETPEEREARRAARFADRRQADQFFFRSKFGRGGERRFNQLAQEFSAGGMSSQMYAARLRILRSELYANQRAQRGFNQSIRDMRSAFIAATASYTAFAGVMGAAKIGQQYESRYAGMLVGTGSAEAAQKQISYLDKEVYRLGLDIQVASQGLVQMSVAAKDVLTQGQIQDLFTGLGELSTAVKLDPFRYEKAIMAISQMLNKGQLMAEEVDCASFYSDVIEKLI